MQVAASCLAKEDDKDKAFDRRQEVTIVVIVSFSFHLLIPHTKLASKRFNISQQTIAMIQKHIKINNGQEQKKLLSINRHRQKKLLKCRIDFHFE